MLVYPNIEAYQTRRCNEAPCDMLGLPSDLGKHEHPNQHNLRCYEITLTFAQASSWCIRRGHLSQKYGIYCFQCAILIMLVLYRYTLKLGQKSCDMVSILKKLALQKELQMNPGLLATKADALPQHHRFNWEYRL